jgi:hypothetical protein
VGAGDGCSAVVAGVAGSTVSPMMLLVDISVVTTDPPVDIEPVETISFRHSQPVDSSLHESIDSNLAQNSSAATQTTPSATRRTS